MIQLSEVGLCSSEATLIARSTNVAPREVVVREGIYIIVCVWGGEHVSFSFPCWVKQLL